MHSSQKLSTHFNYTIYSESIEILIVLYTPYTNTVHRFDGNDSLHRFNTYASAMNLLSTITFLYGISGTECTLTVNKTQRYRRFLVFLHQSSCRLNYISINPVFATECLRTLWSSLTTMCQAHQCTWASFSFWRGHTTPWTFHTLNILSISHVFMWSSHSV